VDRSDLGAMAGLIVRATIHEPKKGIKLGDTFG
jgi:hypothetical protein